MCTHAYIYYIMPYYPNTRDILGNIIQYGTRGLTIYIFLYIPWIEKSRRMGTVCMWIVRRAMLEPRKEIEAGWGGGGGGLRL